MNTETIVITGAGSEMQGVGRLSDGRACFVPFAIPGEKVEIEIINARDRF
ncbi:MAG: TRAM domain-containing protein, partial [Clostridia bacterium]|nr:TRAM domain-containing protein [Clostridia bacterium]